MASGIENGKLFQLLVLFVVHFVVDFYAGLTVPIAEPTLTSHLAVGLPTVAFLVGGCALLVNIIQPVSQWFLPSRGAPILLLVAPLMAACIALIGLSDAFGAVAALLIVSSIGIGVVHPEGALAAHSLAGARKGLGISFFMSGGSLGFATGSLTSGLWTEFHNQGLTHFWWLILPAVVLAALVILSRLHRLKGHMDPVTARDTNGELPLVLVLVVAFCIAISVCLMTRFMPILLVRKFEGMDAQGWAGATVFATGLSSVAGMFLWGYLADRIGSGRTVSMVLPFSLPFFWLIARVDSIVMAPVYGVGIGFTLGALFPLCVLLARHAGGLPQRLRMGLAIGGAFGTGELVFILGGKYVGRFPTGSVDPVVAMLNLCLLLVIMATLAAAIVARIERKA